MKRKYAHRPNWKRVLARRMAIEKFETEAFCGQIVLIAIDRVREALWVNLCGIKQCVVDDGYSWMTIFPKDKNYVVTAMFNKEKQIVQWYIDICGAQGFTVEGMPWYDDLYLDIIISHDHKVSLIDEDDLRLALKQNTITKQQYDFAYQEAERLLKQIRENKFELLEYSLDIYPYMTDKLEQQGN